MVEVLCLLCDRKLFAWLAQHREEKETCGGKTTVERSHTFGVSHLSFGLILQITYSRNQEHKLLCDRKLFAWLAQHREEKETCGGKTTVERSHTFGVSHLSFGLILQITYSRNQEHKLLCDRKLFA